MAKPYLEVTYRGGKPLAAYLYVNRRAGDTAARTERRDDFVIDFSDDGRLIGVELSRLTNVNLSALNDVLSAAAVPTVAEQELAPLRRAA